MAECNFCLVMRLQFTASVCTRRADAHTITHRHVCAGEQTPTHRLRVDVVAHDMLVTENELHWLS